MGRFRFQKPEKRVPGWCEGMRWKADGRLGADFPKAVGEYGSARYSSLSARKGIQVVPRKVFRPESLRLRAFLID